MRWQQIRTSHPGRWVLVEAIEGRSIRGRRVLDDLAVIDEYSSGREALKGYLAHHRRSPERELYVFHTARERLEIEERDMLGLRPGPSRTPPAVVETLLQRIRRDPKVMLGKPVIRGTRITVEILIEKLAAGAPW